MSVESQRRLIGGVRQAVSQAKSGTRRGKPRRQSFEELIEKMEREASAVQAIVALALELAGTDKLLPPEPVPLADDTPTILITDAPVLPPRAEPVSRWINGRRPGPHDILTWEEAMQVPWLEEGAGIQRR